MSTTPELRVGLIGAGRIGSSHAELIARNVPGATLVAIADPTPNAERLAAQLGVTAVAKTADELLARPDVDAVLITTPARTHADLVVQAAAAGKHVFVEKPMAITLPEADRAITAAADAGIVLQVGFNRRFAPAWVAARAAIAAGRIGTPQLLRSLTRDPGPWGADPFKVPRWTIFLETLIHDFDTLCFLNPGRAPVRVTALANALIRPDAKDIGHLDTAVVTVEFEGGAIAVAEASFSALYGYDVRGEAFGSGGMVTMGDGRTSNMTLFGAEGAHVDTARLDTVLLRDAYLGELTAFVEAASAGTPATVDGHDARTALAIALAAIESVKSRGPVEIATITSAITA